MISVAIKKVIENESKEAKTLRDNMLSSIIDGYRKEDVKATESGKPYLENSNVGFSISHSTGAILSAVSCQKKVISQNSAINLYFEGGKDYEIGADIEALGKRNLQRLEKIGDKYFSNAEKQIIFDSNDKELAFFKIWTKKEAYLKLTGVGIKGIATADTELLKKDYIFYSQKVTIDGKEYIFSVSSKR